MMKDGSKIWFDGELIGWDEAQVHVFSHALHYGTSVFEGIRCYKTSDGPAVFRLTDHIRRLFYSAGVMGMKVRFNEKELEAAVIECISANNYEECYVRPLIFYGSGRLGLLADSDNVHVAVMCFDLNIKPGEGREARVMVSGYRRLSPDSVVIDAKVGGYYVNSVLASREAKDAGFDEALLLDHRGFVAEGPGENVFLVRKGKLFTPAKGSILPGITRETVLALAMDRGVKAVEEDIRPEDLGDFEEMFFVGTAVEVWPVTELDKRKVGSGGIGKITSQLSEDYRSLVRGENKKYSKWLNFVKK